MQTRHSYVSGGSNLVFAVVAAPAMTTPAAPSPTARPKAPAFEIFVAVGVLL